MLPHQITFHPNEPDDLHCLQSSVRMAWQGLRGQSLSLVQAEEMTVFRAGRHTWPFAAMLGLAEHGLSVSSIEDFDPYHFAEDPAAEIRRQSGDDEVTEHVLSVSDANAEVERVKACLQHPRIHFERRIPRLSDLQRAVERANTAVICNVNSLALVGRPGYNGHFVLVETVDSDDVHLQNPGLPPVPDQEVEITTFLTAWTSPQESMANALIVSTAP